MLSFKCIQSVTVWAFCKDEHYFITDDADIYMYGSQNVGDIGIHKFVEINLYFVA